MSGDNRNSVRVGSYWHSYNSCKDCSYYIVTDLLPHDRVRIVYVCKCHFGYMVTHDTYAIARDELLLEGERE